jgi:SET domain-containing protein
MKVRVRVGTSRIAGTGLFATQAIPKDTRIVRYIGEKITKAESARRTAQGNAYIFQWNVRYSLDEKTLKNTARYINHSCAPNCETLHTQRVIWIVAVRDIHEGEELAYNYGYDMEDYEDFPCTCGATQCCGSSIPGTGA